MRPKITSSGGSALCSVGWCARIVVVLTILVLCGIPSFREMQASASPKWRKNEFPKSSWVATADRLANSISSKVYMDSERLEGPAETDADLASDAKGEKHGSMRENNYFRMRLRSLSINCLTTPRVAILSALSLRNVSRSSKMGTCLDTDPARDPKPSPLRPE